MMEYYSCKGCKHARDGKHGEMHSCGICHAWDNSRDRRGSYSPIQEEPKMEKWKSLKPITLQAIYVEIDGNCYDFTVFAKRCVAAKVDYGWDTIPTEFAQSVAEYMGYPTWFIDHGFIEEVKEWKFWKVGGRVINKGNQYIIANSDYNKVNLISLNTGCRITTPIENLHMDKITLAEMREMGYEGN